MAATILVMILSIATSSFSERQQLKVHRPQMANIEQESGFTLYEKGIPRATVDGFRKYLTERFRGYDLRTVVISKMPQSQGDFFVIVQRGSESDERNSFLVLRKYEEEISEISSVENDITCGMLNPDFFVGRDRTLIVISIAAFDGGYCGNFPFEYTNGRIRALGDIPVYDGVHGPGGFQGHSPIERATAQYSNGTYYVTMRGRGSLYEGEKTRVARRGVPVTYVFKNGTFVRVRSKGTRR